VILCLGTTPVMQRTMVFDRLRLDAVNRAVEDRDARARLGGYRDEVVPDARAAQVLADEFPAVPARKAGRDRLLAQRVTDPRDVERLSRCRLVNLDRAVDRVKAQAVEDHRPLHDRRCPEAENHGTQPRACPETYRARRSTAGLARELSVASTIPLVSPQDARFAMSILLGEQAAEKLSDDQARFLVARDHLANELAALAKEASRLKRDNVYHKLGIASCMVGAALTRRDFLDRLPFIEDALLQARREGVLPKDGFATLPEGLEKS